MVPPISPEELKSILGQDKVLVVDVRDAPELTATGKVQGALNVSRGMLEFRADETTPYHDKSFTKDKTIVLYCTSGGRPALGGQALMELGYRDVRNLARSRIGSKPVVRSTSHSLRLNSTTSLRLVRPAANRIAVLCVGCPDVASWHLAEVP